jgi:hypothetical protein
MPTGYTHKIAEGITFREFALTCARAFGATIMLRDEPLSSEIPEFEPDTHNATRLKESQEHLNKLMQYNQEDWERDCEAFNEQAMASALKRIEENNALHKKYVDMLQQAKAWTPPTPEHNGIKKFMIEQIELSIKGDCYPIEIPKQRTWGDHKSETLKSARWDVDYHYKANEDEIRRTHDRNEWVSALKNSLPEIN